MRQNGNLARRLSRFGGINQGEELYGWLFISPWLIGFLVFTLGPLLASLVLMFFNYAGFGRITYVGVEHFRELVLYDFRFHDSLRVSATYAFWHVTLSISIALGLALIVNQRMRGHSIYRAIYYLPAAVSGVAMTYVWAAMLDREYGLFNQILRGFGLPRIGWLVTVEWALPSYIIMSLYSVGTYMIIMLAGLQSIPDQLLEAASIDGAGDLRRFWHITLPLLSPTLFFLVVIGIIGSLQVFMQGYMLTAGGPVRSTLFYVLYLYNTAFVERRFGYASVLAWILFLIIMILTIIQFRLARHWVYYETEVA